VEAGADDLNSEDDQLYEIYTDPDQLETVQAELEKNNVIISSAERTMIPQNTIKLEDKTAEQMLKLMETLDDHDDIQEIYANFDIDDDVMAKVAE
jgi:transcriptional/translational regulatory protein YebC/TACO1